MKRFGTILEKHAGDVVLMFVFLYLAMRIYVDAYLHETMMSPDSCGYLREALNLAQGNGFRCDEIKRQENLRSVYLSFMFGTLQTWQMERFR